MIKRLAYIFVFVCIFTSYATSQNKTLVVYVDASASSNHFLLKNKIFDALQEADSKLVLFISNDSLPLICNSIFDAQKTIESIDKIKTSKPNVLFDLNRINKIFNEDSILSNLNEIENTKQEEATFFFFFDAKQCRLYQQDNKIAKALLLSNRLINKNGLQRNCKATLYIHRMQNEDLEYFSKVKEDGIFKIEVY